MKTRNTPEGVDYCYLLCVYANTKTLRKFVRYERYPMRNFFQGPRPLNFSITDDSGTTRAWIDMKNVRDAVEPYEYEWYVRLNNPDAVVYSIGDDDGAPFEFAIRTRQVFAWDAASSFDGESFLSSIQPVWWSMISMVSEITQGHVTVGDVKTSIDNTFHSYNDLNYGTAIQSATSGYKFPASW